MIDSLVYALVQVAHNFGAVAIVGGAFCALTHAGMDARFTRRMAVIVLAGWLTQAISGATFGAVSIYFYGQPPDIHAYAMGALVIKIIATVLGIVFAASCLLPATRELGFVRKRAWPLLAVLGVVALTAAAVLRWFA